ncbi:alpha-amylase family glycosyl hydrolase [Botrimarina sp.]|uniref:alpha-amylase family glycosyl hydrolase n=1 Tax=Botrimarina sp. TaxID=2795802 RepID=UPI0032F09274
MPTLLDLSAAPLGAALVEGGVTFRVWAPHADRVSVVGEFNDWSDQANPMEKLDGGQWAAFVEGAEAGQRYRFLLATPWGELSRIDPYAREVTNSVGDSVVHDPSFDWQDDRFRLADRNRLVIYELHVGTFHRADKDEVGSFDEAADKLDYLQWLGVNAIEVMPTAEFAGDLSWGYNPAHLFAVESGYGGPRALKRFVREAHRRGIGVIMDVVYNHLGPSDLDLWQFDGWSENGKGGVYFYNDHRSSTPWGDTRPDYGRGEVRQFLFDNAMMWIEEYHMDGLRYDMTLYMRSIHGDDATAIPEGWTLAQWINREVRSRYPHKVTIAEDLRTNDAITKPEKWGGANFHAQWDERFVHPIRSVLLQVDDAHRSMAEVREALTYRYNHDAFERVVYTESHDEVANGKARVPTEIDAEAPSSWHARKRSTLGLALALTAPGVPMLFQGQEFLRVGWFQDTRPLDWRRADTQQGTLRLARDLIGLRLDRDGFSGGLTGQRIEVLHVNDSDKVIAYRRWDDGGPGDDVLCVANFSARRFDDYRLGVPTAGAWRLRCNSDAAWYTPDGETGGPGPIEVGDFATQDHPYDGQQQSALVTLPPYTMLIYSQD